MPVLSVIFGRSAGAKVALAGVAKVAGRDLSSEASVAAVTAAVSVPALASPASLPEATDARHDAPRRGNADTDGMDVTAKLQIKPGQRVATVATQDAAPISLPAECESVADPAVADVVIAFVRARAELRTVAAPAVAAARLDKLAWIAYPKAGKLGTDLNRDVLRESLATEGVQPVRQIAIDDVWSALRFRPG